MVELAAEQGAIFGRTDDQLAGRAFQLFAEALRGIARREGSSSVGAIRDFVKKGLPMIAGPLKFGHPWTECEIAQLEQLAKENLPIAIIAKRLRRTEGAVRDRAKRHAITLKPRKRSRPHTSFSSKLIYSNN